ncbi:MAG: chemoreceptor glutamine deamidase CheD [Oleiphilaceae bacterium]|nr:chemoreceptor glutamine deamidase CheD [Oleiphilaceae bacterium]
MEAHQLPGTLPPAEPGFEHINRYWDRRMNMPAAKILPGEFYVSRCGEIIATVLGSCIAACICDRQLGVGGMNHFMLPQEGEHSTDNWGGDLALASRYGNWAMEYLINEILKMGGTRKNLEVKVFGGGNVLSNMTEIGTRNVDFVRSYLAREGLSISAMDVGGAHPRKVLYFPDTGAVKMKRLISVANDTIAQRERDYRSNLNKPADTGDVELF